MSPSCSLTSRVQRRLYVELGAQDCQQCTSRFLRDRGWRGLVLDGEHADASINLQKERLDADMIGPLLQKYSVPEAFDHMTIDLDLNTWWILQGAAGAGRRIHESAVTARHCA